MRCKSLVPALFLCFAVDTAHATVIFSNLNTDPTSLFDVALFSSLFDQPPGFPRAEAVPFTISGSTAFTVTQIDVAIRFDFGGDNAAQLTLTSDANGGPGQPLGSWTVHNLPYVSHVSSNCCELVSLILADAATSVNPGSTYWLTVTPIGRTVGLAWFWNNTGSIGQSYHTDQQGRWIANAGRTLAAFEVIGEAVAAPAPEPASAGIALIGLLGVGILRRRIQS